MGPQVSYYSPQILMEEDIHGPGIDADGAAFPGVNLYVELGHGRDYAWSATSAGQDIVDTFAVPLCSPGGGPVSLDVRPLPARRPVRGDADADPDRLVGPQPRRLDPGGVDDDADPADRVRPRDRPRADPRATGGLHQPALDLHARARLRARVRALQRPRADPQPPGLLRRAPTTSATRSTGSTPTTSTSRYFNSGHNPIRAPHTDPLFPTWASNQWRGATPSPTVTPDSTGSAQTAQSAHPQAIDQGVLTSWNNKQAPGYNDPATAQQFSSIYRSQLLDLGITARARRRRRKADARPIWSTRWATPAPRICGGSRCSRTCCESSVIRADRRSRPPSQR